MSLGGKNGRWVSGVVIDCLFWCCSSVLTIKSFSPSPVFIALGSAIRGWAAISEKRSFSCPQTDRVAESEQGCIRYVYNLIGVK